MGFKESYVIDRVGQVKILGLLTRWVGGSKKASKYAYVIYEWSLSSWSFGESQAQIDDYQAILASKFESKSGTIARSTGRWRLCRRGFKERDEAKDRFTTIYYAIRFGKSKPK